MLGETGYKRDRNLEFSAKGLTRSELTAIVQAATTELSAAFDKITDEQLDSEYPVVVLDQKLSTLEFLTHLAVHLSYHLGQIDYHRRLLTDSSQSVDTMSPRELTPFGR